MSLNIESGTTVYNSNGDEGRYVQPVQNNDGFSAHVVIPIVLAWDPDRQDEYPCDGAPTLWCEVFTKPVVGRRPDQIKRLDDEIERLTAECSALRAEATKLRNETYMVRRDFDARLAEVQQYRGLSRIADFMAGRMTHFVHTDHNVCRVVEKDEFLKAGRYSNGGLKLLTLFGNMSSNAKKAEVGWYVNEYSDGSGSKTSCFPFCDRGEAVEFAERFLIACVANVTGSDKNTVRLYTEKGMSAVNDLEKLRNNFTSLELSVPEELTKVIADRDAKAEEDRRLRLVKDAKNLASELEAAGLSMEAVLALDVPASPATAAPFRPH